jgi:hypothetical protein
MIGVPGYVGDIIALTSPSHGGDTGSKPVGTASNINELQREHFFSMTECSHFALVFQPTQSCRSLSALFF